jgi:indole-3-glycerol phosphate synthase
MTSILDRIVEDTRDVLARRRRDVPLSALESREEFTPERRSLHAALAVDGLSIIAECKRASPSKGMLRETYEPAAIAGSYAVGGAAAVSVLTEPVHFRGDPADLREVRAAVDIPLLRKDFVVDPYQIVEARAWGADAVLLIAAVLDRHQLAELHAAARDYELDALVELYNPRELDIVDLDRVRIVGVNSRDLRTFEVDVDAAAQTLAALPEGILTVAESGISAAATLVDLQKRGIDAALIGETFMRAGDPGEAVRTFTEALRSARQSD